MKRKDWICLILAVLCLLLFFGYRAYTGMAEDNTAPKISFTEGVPEVSVNDPESALIAGVTAKDKRDGDVSSSIIVESVKLTEEGNTATVTYAAFDKSGNVAKASREIVYTDYESPKFSLTKPLSFQQGSNFDVLSLIKATDATDGDISHRIRATPLDDVAITTLGSHDVEFRVSNSMGDTERLTLPVEVYDSGKYTGTLNLKNYLLYLEKGESFDVRSQLDSVTFGSDTTYLRQSIPSGFSWESEGEVDTRTPGMYIVEYEVSYYTGWIAHSRIIVIVEG